MATKTKVRIQRVGHPKDYYQHLIIQILGNRYPDSPNTSLAPIGSIHWQGDSKHGWYGMSLQVECGLSEIGNLKEMAKVGERIKQSELSWKPTPENILQAIDSEEYHAAFGLHIPLSANGQNIYNVYQGESIWTRLVAPDEKTAWRMVKKLKLNGEIKLEVEFTNIQFDAGDISLQVDSDVESIAA